METNESDPLRGVPLSALGVALIRARESNRHDRLYDDPVAVHIATAARAAFAAVPGGADRWARIEHLAHEFYEGRTASVRAVDDRIREWVTGGGRQVVMVGAGLDARPFRMELPPDVRWIEIDLPETFEFKDRLTECFQPHCARRVIAADLCSDWEPSLLDTGFRPGVPSLWVDEGAVPYLPHEGAMSVLATITRLSAPRSEILTVAVGTDAREHRYRDLRDLVTTSAPDQPIDRGIGVAGPAWLREHGWRLAFDEWDEIVRPYRRHSALTGKPSDGFLRAVRRG
ncbi:SAM-dependent methyltransferase [Tsukamurella sp. 8F]|uniref:SAM-dependent methyltransferase n=1 Tax=unclassified Tsukamurella TaxID=2633480 RepID=UPI0023B90769|nr:MULTISPECIES: SAM-dependent methyltransferase [unclassified Tsukamurella]MDF0529683.1 SAM-dependent methyltransferase [Tsukamurella sp. 8J]MDF0585968.1 SAM-dependent methyltransferase [Tsukamurella sp. 8F]